MTTEAKHAYETPEAVRKGRNDPMGFVLYFDMSEASGELETWQEEWASSHAQTRVLLLNHECLRPLLAAIGALLEAGLGIELKDAAERAVYDFVHAGEDRQAAARPAAAGMFEDYGKSYVPGHPEADPFYGLNDKLTAAEQDRSQS